MAAEHESMTPAPDLAHSWLNRLVTNAYNTVNTACLHLPDIEHLLKQPAIRYPLGVFFIVAGVKGLLPELREQTLQSLIASSYEVAVRYVAEEFSGSSARYGRWAISAHGLLAENSAVGYLASIKGPVIRSSTTYCPPEYTNYCNYLPSLSLYADSVPLGEGLEVSFSEYSISDLLTADMSLQAFLQRRELTQLQIVDTNSDKLLVSLSVWNSNSVPPEAIVFDNEHSVQLLFRGEPDDYAALSLSLESLSSSTAPNRAQELFTTAKRGLIAFGTDLDFDTVAFAKDLYEVYEHYAPTA